MVSVVCEGRKGGRGKGEGGGDGRGRVKGEVSTLKSVTSGELIREIG